MRSPLCRVLTLSGSRSFPEFPRAHTLLFSLLALFTAGLALFTAGLLLPTRLVAADTPVLVMEPGQLKTLQPKEFITVGRTTAAPALGDVKTEHELRRVTVEQDGSTVTAIQTRVLGKRREKAQIATSPDAIAGAYTLVAQVDSREFVFQEVIYDQYSGKPTRRNQWVEREHTIDEHRYPMLVKLVMPEVLLGPNDAVVLTVPPGVSDVSASPTETSRASVEFSADGRIRVAAIKPGPAHFTLSYKIGAHELRTKLSVKVLKTEKVHPVELTVGEVLRVPTKPIDKMLRLSKGRFAEVGAPVPPDIAAVAFDGFGLDVTGLQPGTTRVRVSFMAKEKGKKRAKRFHASVILAIEVKPVESDAKKIDGGALLSTLWCPASQVRFRSSVDTRLTPLSCLGSTADAVETTVA